MQNHQCSCGHSHQGDHDHDHHQPTHAESCGCGCGHTHEEIAPVGDLSILQQNILFGLYERSCLPVARFTMTSTKDEALYAVALAPVYLGSAEDTMEQVKLLGAELLQLAQGGLITLDYDISLKGYAYLEYDNAALFHYFIETVQEGSTKSNALFDVANIEKGSMALTDIGTQRVTAMLG